jgi:hypothetical protein
MVVAQIAIPIEDHFYKALVASSKKCNSSTAIAVTVGATLTDINSSVMVAAVLMPSKVVTSVAL